jgi:NTP pyrophosphatase (non-canonical NTP hydrolase)
MNVREIQRRLADFAEKRNWGQFHSPKNLSMALAVEAAELLELFQWLTEEESREVAALEKEMALVREELADVLIYLLRLADVLEVDLARAVEDKIALNEERYPVSLSRDRAEKWDRRET